MSRHLDGSPKPADPVWYRQHEVLHVRCACGHRGGGVIGHLAHRAGMGGHQRMWDLVRRLRCSACGGRDPVVEVGAR